MQSKSRLQRGAEGFIGAALALMTVLVFVNTAGRYLFRTGITVSEEISQLAFVWLVFIGAIIGVREHTHLGMDMLVRMMPRAVKRPVIVLVNLLILYGLWLLGSGSWTQTLIGMDTTTPMAGMPIGLFALAGLTAAVGMAALYVFDTFRVITGRVADEELDQFAEGEGQGEVEQALEDAAKNNKRAEG